MNRNGEELLRVLLVEPGNRPRTVELPHTLEAMQQTVGGLIQAIYPFEEPVALVCNDEGKLLGLPLNRVLRQSTGKIYAVVAGTFFLCRAPADSDQLDSLTEEQMARFSQRFRYPELFLRPGSDFPAGPIRL